MIQAGKLLNSIGGKWQHSQASEFLDVRNPATGEKKLHVPISPAAEGGAADRAA